MNRTSIEWVKNPDGSQGCSLNSKTGCRNHTPEGLCLGGLFPCYAFKVANGRLKPLYLANAHLALPDGTLAPQTIERAYLDPFYPRFWPERLKQPKQTLKSTGIFLDDMSDWMGDYWPKLCTERELAVMRENPQHRIYTLTKQPQNLPKFSPFPDNCWVGVTATNSIMFAAAYFHLVRIKAKIKYISLEPLLAWDDRTTMPMLGQSKQAGIDWLIIGACTGTGKDINTLNMRYPDLDPRLWGKKVTLQPKIDWVREIIEAAEQAGIPVFLKDNLKPLVYSECGIYSHPWAFRNWELRQEMPK